MAQTTRARFTVLDHGAEVVLTPPDDIGEMQTTSYFCPRGPKGGYVRIYDDARRYPQVCALLSNRGPTLVATEATLAAVIRREYRRGRAHNRRQRDRW